MTHDRLIRARHWFAFSLVGLAGCQAGPTVDTTRHKRSWVGFEASAVDRDNDDAAADVESGGAFGMVGGYDIWVTPVRVGPEIEMSITGHDVDIPGTSDTGELIIWRGGLGIRASGDLIAERLAAHLRGGAYLSDETEKTVNGLASDRSGFYYGGGLDFWIDDTTHIGPFVTFYDSSDDDVRDMYIGLTVAFHF